MKSLTLMTSLLMFLVPRPAEADVVRVAVAANFLAPLKVLAEAFEGQTGHSLKISSGSTGSLYAQIKNGAPHHVFLAADEARPALLKGRRFTYALGRLALYASESGQDLEAKLKSGAYDRLALANPKTAPYGRAAFLTLGALGLSPKENVVRGESVGQALQYILTGNVDMGFVALSQVKQLKGGSRWEVPADLHTPIRQQAVVLVDKPGAVAFADFLQTDETKARIRAFGYGTE